MANRPGTRQKLVQILCRLWNWERGFLRRRQKTKDKDLIRIALPDPTVWRENIGADHGRGIWVMKSVMDEVSFERGGTEGPHAEGTDTPAGKPSVEAPTK